MSDAQNLIWRDGELIPFAEATIHVLSHAANRGSEVFDVLRVLPSAEGPSAVGLRDHVARFDHSMRLMGMDSPYELSYLERAVAQTVLANPGWPECMVKLVAAWSEVAAATMPESSRPAVFVAVVASTNSVLGGPAAKIQTATMAKIPASILPPSLKVAASYTPGVRHQLAARAAGFDDVLFRTVDGSLAEAPSQSLLVVTGGRILAPPLDSVLDGITRRLLIDLALDRGIPVEIREVTWAEVTGASELILSSTSRFVRPLGQLDDQIFTVPGPIAVQLATEVGRLVEGRHRLSSRWLTPLGALVA